MLEAHKLQEMENIESCSSFQSSKRFKKEKSSKHTLDGGAKKTISDISPTEIHPYDSKRDNEDPARAGGENPLDGFVFGSDGSEPGNR